MADIVLKDIDAVLADRIKRMSELHGWTMHKTLLQLIEQGLYVCEGGGAVHFDSDESNVLQSIISALEEVPNDPGFSLIGRIESMPNELEEPNSRKSKGLPPL